MNKPRKKTPPWDQTLWGVQFRSPMSGPFLIGTTWANIYKSQYDGEPVRALLFRFRSQAVEWAKTQRVKYAQRLDCCGDWRFTVVRVREVVGKVRR
jgi:hypothetical protein